jgi:hypothetical protein
LSPVGCPDWEDRRRYQRAVRTKHARIPASDAGFPEFFTFISPLTGQSADHEKLSWERPGKVEAGRLTSNCWEAKNFSFPVDFFRNQVILDRHLRAPSHQNEERLAGQVAAASFGL